jgi:phage shock protein A
MNTVAARRSRARKAGFIKELEDELEKARTEMDEWRARAEAAEEIVRLLKGDV